MKQFLRADHSEFVQISPKLAKDFINQIAVPVSSNKALLIKVLNTVRPTRPLWELYVNNIIILQDV